LLKVYLVVDNSTVRFTFFKYVTKSFVFEAVLFEVSGAEHYLTGKTSPTTVYAVAYPR